MCTVATWVSVASLQPHCTKFPLREFTVVSWHSLHIISRYSYSVKVIPFARQQELTWGSAGFIILMLLHLEVSSYCCWLQLQSTHVFCQFLSWLSRPHIFCLCIDGHMCWLPLQCPIISYDQIFTQRTRASIAVYGVLTICKMSGSLGVLLPIREILTVKCIYGGQWNAKYLC